MAFVRSDSLALSLPPTLSYGGKGQVGRQREMASSTSTVHPRRRPLCTFVALPSLLSVLLAFLFFTFLASRTSHFGLVLSPSFQAIVAAPAAAPSPPATRVFSRLICTSASVALYAALTHTFLSPLSLQILF